MLFSIWPTSPVVGHGSPHFGLEITADGVRAMSRTMELRIPFAFDLCLRHCYWGSGNPSGPFTCS